MTNLGIMPAFKEQSKEEGPQRRLRSYSQKSLWRTIDWMFGFPPKFHMLKPNPQCDGIWRWGHWEGGGLMNGISTLIKEMSESSLAPTAVWGHSKKMGEAHQIYPSQEIESASDLSLPMPWSFLLIPCLWSPLFPSHSFRRFLYHPPGLISQGSCSVISYLLCLIHFWLLFYRFLSLYLETLESLPWCKVFPWLCNPLMLLTCFSSQSSYLKEWSTLSAFPCSAPITLNSH